VNPTPSPTDEKSCPEFVLNKHAMKAKGKGKKENFTGESAEDVLCQCEEKCKGEEGSKYWSCKLNKSGNKGSCICYSGKLKKVKPLKAKKNGAVGSIDEKGLEEVQKKAPQN